MTKRRAITPDEVGSYAASAALQEAVEQGILTQDQLVAISDRANEFAHALLSGMVLMPNKETGRYEITPYAAAKFEADDDDLVIGD